MHLSLDKNKKYLCVMPFPFCDQYILGKFTFFLDLKIAFQEYKQRCFFFSSSVLFIIK